MKRGKIQIIGEVLQLCKEPKSKTQIVYDVNLNFKTVDYYLNLLIKNVLLKKIGDKYCTSERGRAVADSLKTINREFE